MWRHCLRPKEEWNRERGTYLLSLAFETGCAAAAIEWWSPSQIPPIARPAADPGGGTTGPTEVDPLKRGAARGWVGTRGQALQRPRPATGRPDPSDPPSRWHVGPAPIDPAAETRKGERRWERAPPAAAICKSCRRRGGSAGGAQPASHSPRWWARPRDRKRHSAHACPPCAVRSDWMNPPDRWRQLVCTWARPLGGWGLTHLLRRVGVSSQWAAMMVDKKDRFVTDTMCSFPAHARALLCFF
jgi:hypothetical protein